MGTALIQTDRINEGLTIGKQWTSPLHRSLAEFALGMNPLVRDQKQLQHYVSIINAIPKGEIHKVNCKTLADLGITIPEVPEF